MNALFTNFEPSLPAFFLNDVLLLGINAPVFLWLGSVILIEFTFYHFVRLWIQTAVITSGLRKLVFSIRAIEPVGQPIDGFGLEKIRDAVSRNGNQIVKHCWGEFEETLLSEESEGGKHKVFNTRQSDEYFTKESILNSRISIRFFETLPGLLTGCGLLLTFLAILIGLSHIHSTTDSVTGVEKLTGVKELVYSLSGKFLSSIVALTCATLFALFEKYRVKQAEEAYHDFVGTLDSRFDRRSSEHILEELLKHSAEQSIAFRQFNTDLSTHLSKAMQEGNGPLIERLTNAIDQLAKQKSESLSESLGAIVSEFRGALMSSTHNQFDELSNSLTATASLLETMNEQNKLTQERLMSLMGQLDVFLTKQSETGEAQLQNLQTTMSDLLTKLVETADGTSGAMQARTNEVLGRLEESSRRQAEENFQQTQKLTQLVESMSRKLEASMAMSAESVQSTVSTMLSKTSDWSDASSTLMLEIMEEQGKNTHAVAEARDALVQAIGSFKQVVSENNDTLLRLRDVSSSFKDIGHGVAVSIEKLGSAQKNAAELSLRSKESFEGLSTTIKRNSELLSRYEQTFSQLDKSIGSVLKQIATNMEQYNNLVRTGLQRNLTDFDDLLASATGKLGSTINQLNESLDELTDFFEVVTKDDRIRVNA